MHVEGKSGLRDGLHCAVTFPNLSLSIHQVMPRVAFEDGWLEVITLLALVN